MGNVPKLCFQTLVGSLTLPRVVHGLKGLIYARYVEEFVLCAVDEKHCFRTGNAGHMGIVEPSAQTGEAIGKATIFSTVVVERHLVIGGGKPADGSTGFYTVA